MKNFLKKNLLFLLAILLIGVCHGQTTNSPIDTRGQVFRKDTIPLKSKSKTTKPIPKQIRSVPFKKIPLPYRSYLGIGVGVAWRTFSVKGITSLELPYEVIGNPAPQIYNSIIDGQQHNNSYWDIPLYIEFGDVNGIFGFIAGAFTLFRLSPPFDNLVVSRFEFGIGRNFVVNNHFKISPTISFGPRFSTLKFPQMIDNRNMDCQILDTSFPYRFTDKRGRTKFSDEIEFRLGNTSYFFSIQCGFSPRIKNRIKNDFPMRVDIGYTMNFYEEETYLRVLSPAAEKRVKIEEYGINIKNTVSTKNMFLTLGVFVQLSYFINSRVF